MKLTIKFLLLFFVLLSFSALAESGCFLYQDSPFYCQVISKAQAAEECVFHRCNAQEFFIRDDCSLLQECEKIFCISSCTEEYLGRCSAGEVSDAEWCTPGCCQFTYSDATFCDFVGSKNLCVIEVKNKDVTEFRFSPLDQASCQTFCQEGKLLPEDETQLPQNKTVFMQEKKDETKKEETPSYLFWILLLLALAFAFLFQLLWKRAHRYLPEKEARRSEKKIPWYAPFPSSEKIRSRIEAVKQHRQQKVKKHQREEFLVEADLLPEKPKEAKEDLFKQLQKVVKKKEPEKSPLQVLEEWGKK